MSHPTIMKINYYCPRCGTNEISEYKDTFECMKCRDKDGFPLEFEKKLIGQIPDDDIMTIREMDAFVDTFDEVRDSEKRKRYFDSLSDDDLEP